MIFDGQDLARWVTGQWQGSVAASIQGFSHDTRTLKPGECFLALKTEKRDGHVFLKTAQEAGASAALVEGWDPQCTLPQLKVQDTWEAVRSLGASHRQAFQGPIIGVTGSCGKTSTKDLLKFLLGEKQTHATYENNNNILGVPLTLLGLDPKEHKFGVIEAGINMPHEMDLIAPMIEPDVAVVTLVAPVHIEHLGDEAGVAHEKAKLAASVREGGLCAFPESCLRYKAFQSLSGDLHVLTSVASRVNKTSFSGCTRILFQDVRSKAKKILEVSLGETPKRTFRLPYVSSGMVQNAALAIHVASTLGVSDEDIQARIGLWKPGAWRGQVYASNGTYYYADCYNANPMAVLDALSVFEDTFSDDTPRLYVLGGMGELGDLAGTWHQEIGGALHLRPQDRMLLHGACATDTRLGALKAGNASSQIDIVEDRSLLAGPVQSFAGAVFLKASKPYKFWDLIPQDATLVNLL